ncbi:MAG: hypothetical protein J3R72DRAFT_432785 [Linnemannia gamsii]|nr:MAG: hypothetical protein J3R72DRAFT_432785 [Linnemannia gamsii]
MMGTDLPIGDICVSLFFSLFTLFQSYPSVRPLTLHFPTSKAPSYYPSLSLFANPPLLPHPPRSCSTSLPVHNTK